MGDAAIPIPLEQQSAKRLKLVEEDKPQVVEKVMEDGVIPIPLSGERQSTGEEQLKGGEEDKAQVLGEIMQSFKNRYDKDNEDEEVYRALMQEYSPILDKNEEAYRMIHRYVADNLPAFMRNRYSDEDLNRLHLTRKELERTRQERVELTIARRFEALQAAPDYVPYKPPYGPDDPLPEGHVWISGVPGSCGKHFVTIMNCGICCGDHWDENCPQRDNPPPRVGRPPK